MTAQDHIRYIKKEYERDNEIKYTIYDGVYNLYCSKKNITPNEVALDMRVTTNYGHIIDRVTRVEPVGKNLDTVIKKEFIKSLLGI